MIQPVNPQPIIVRPGDTLIFRFDQHLSDADVHEARRRIAPNIPEGIDFLIVGKNVTIDVLRPGERGDTA
jgi:hypothetical protein